jgi:hypothetical protein
MKHGPKVNKLIIHKMSMDMVPPGGGLPDAINGLLNIQDHARKATKLVESALDAVKKAPGSQWHDDELIADEILKGIENRKRKNGHT